MWIQGAYTKEHLRGKGIGSALLKQALKWARSQGYGRCAVDFEAENVLACAFWLRYFEPTCFSLVRHINVDTIVERG
jgi:GNAT superfamily N-acetyltransferase